MLIQCMFSFKKKIKKNTEYDRDINKTLRDKIDKEKIINFILCIWTSFNKK